MESDNWANELMRSLSCDLAKKNRPHFMYREVPFFCCSTIILVIDGFFFASGSDESVEKLRMEWSVNDSHPRTQLPFSSICCQGRAIDQPSAIGAAAVAIEKRKKKI
jgi:hypothetical protein